MDNLRMIIAANLSQLRKSQNLTQAEFAERINYSDKAISKWERGESLPDILILKSIADMYHVSVDRLLCEDGISDNTEEYALQEQTRQKVLVACLWVSMVWIIAAVCFSYILFNTAEVYWMAFVWAVPASFAVAIIFIRKWSNRKLLFTFFSGLVWSILISLYLQFISYNIWMVFLIGVPVQFAIIIGANIRPDLPRHFNKSNK